MFDLIRQIISLHYHRMPKAINRMKTGISNEVYQVELDDISIIIRMSMQIKYLMGSHDHIPQLKSLEILVPDILFEDYSKKIIPIAYQIQNKIEGSDLGEVIESLTDDQLTKLALEIASIFKKVATLPTSHQFGVVWGGGDNELNNSWTERMRIWIDESKERGMKTGVMDERMAALAESIFDNYQVYFDNLKPVTYFGDICSKNVMIHQGRFNGLVDLDGLTQGDPLEAIGRIKLSWYGTHYGDLYSNAIMDALNLDQTQRKMVLVYCILNQLSWTCENGIQFNLNTTATVDHNKVTRNKKILYAIEKDVN